MRYQRRTPIEDCRWPVASHTTLPLEWSGDMAYIVGLTATDGCLVSGRNKVNFKSNDRELVSLYLALLGRTNRIREQRSRTGGIAYFTEFSDAKLYRWLQSVGLTPRKSLTLGALTVPDAFLASLLRGLLEGDGTIQNFRHHPTLDAYPGYSYERLWTFFTSASQAHVDWIQTRVRARYGLTGRIECLRRDGRHDFFRLKYGNRESVTLLSVIYPSADVPKLERKWKIWADYRARKGLE